jgi:putative phage-type endonuclease
MFSELEPLQALPHGVEVIDPADREAWLAVRKQDVTASTAGCLMGIHPYTTPYELWADKTGRLADKTESAAMRRGTAFEPVALELLRHQRPNWKVEYPLGNRYFRDPAARLGATPDAFVARPDRAGRGICQAKTVARRAFIENWIDPNTDDVVLPLWIAVQAIVEADLTGSPHACVLAVVTPFELDELVEGLLGLDYVDIDRTLHDVAFAWLATGKLEVHVIDVPVHAGVRASVREKVSAFWSIVDAGDHPPVDWDRDGSTVLDVFRSAMPDRRDLTADSELDAIVQRYVEAGEREREAKKLRSILKPQIIYALGNSEEGVTSSWSLSAKTQYREAHEVAASETRTLRAKPRSPRHADF